MRRSSVLAPVALLFLVSCSSSSGGPAGGDAATTEPPPATSPLGDPTPETTGSDQPRDEPPREVPDELRFTALRLGGGTIDGVDYAGKDLVIWFWAPW